MFKHTFYTWLLANLFHPFFFICFMGIGDGWYYLLQYKNVLSIYFSIQVYSLFFSLPCLLLGWLCLRIINKTPLTVTAKIFLWVAITSMMIVAFVLIILSTTGSFQPGDLFFSIPGVVSVCLAICIRARQFCQMILSLQPNDHEPASV